MHVFDIRRSNSVTELWKKFQYPTYSQSAQGADQQDTNSKIEHAPPSHEGTAASDTNNAEASPAENSGSQPLLSAFEAELAKLLNAPVSPNVQPLQQNPSFPMDAQSEPTSSGRVQNPADAFAQAINNIVDGAEIVRDEVRSRIPDFERQLHNAQRALPEQVGMTLQVALTTLESHVRTLASALNNVYVPTEQRAGPNSQTQPSPARHTVDGLRTMASEIGQMGQTLFAAFEREFGRVPSLSLNPILSQGIPAPVNTNNQEQTGTPGTSAADTTVPPTDPRHSCPIVRFDNEKETLVSDNAETESVAQSNEADGERNAAHSRPYSEYIRPQQHLFPQRPRFTTGRGNRSLASDVYQQSSINFPLRHPSHHQRFHPPSFPPFIPPSIPQARLAYPAPPIAAAPPIPPFWYTADRPSVYSRQRRTEAPPGNESSESLAKNTNPFSMDNHESDARRSASSTLFVGNVGFNVSESMIRTVFASKGFLVDANLPLDSPTGKHAGFGYLKFASIHAAKAALEALQGTHIDGHSINLEFSDNSPITALHTSHGSQEASPHPIPIPEAPKNVPNPDDTSARPKKPCVKEQGSKRKQHTSGDRRKSFTFTEPSPSLNTVAEPEVTNPSGSHVSPEPPALLDQDNGDSDFAARYPSLLPNKCTKPSRFDSTIPGNLVPFSPEMEMRRFPPVSQLDAHALANRRREVQPTAASSTAGPKANRGNHTEGGNAASPVVPNSVPSQAGLEMFGQSTPNRLNDGLRGLRRSNTMMPVNPSARLSGPFDPLSPVESGNPVGPLRRSATQRDALRTTDFTSADTLWSRHPSGPPAHPTGLSKAKSYRNRRRFSVEDLPHDQGSDVNAASNGGNHARQSRVNDDRCSISACVAILLNLGYGGVQDGGRSRITMYAEVAGGNVSEAIELIEEDRKAYEQRSPSMR